MPDHGREIELAFDKAIADHVSWHFINYLETGAMPRPMYEVYIHNQL